MKNLHFAFAAACVAIFLISNNAQARDDRERGKYRAFDVCVGGLDAAFNDDAGMFTFPPTIADVVVAVGMVLPRGTIPADGSGDPTCDSYAINQIGTYFVRGIILAGLGRAAADDFGYMDWHFRIDGVGAFDTSGPVNTGALGSRYPHTIVGGTGRFRGLKGEITTLVLAEGGFQARVFLRGGKD